MQVAPKQPADERANVHQFRLSPIRPAHAAAPSRNRFERLPNVAESRLYRRQQK
jgi:hypothetical protein